MIHSIIATFVFRVPLSYLFGQIDSASLHLMGFAPPISTFIGCRRVCRFLFVFAAGKKGCRCDGSRTTQYFQEIPSV